MPGPDQEVSAPGASPSRSHGALGRLGAALVRRRGVLLAPFFGAALVLARPSTRELELDVAAFALALGAWALRVWAMGYRNWVRGPGERHLMTRGPYAWLRHPRYAANFVAGLAWFVLAFQPVAMVAYATIYWLVLGAVMAREEEKLAQDYPGFGAWRARVPLLVPRPWRRPWLETRSTDPAERWEAATVLSGLELVKLALFLVALATFAWARRTGTLFELEARWLGGAP